MTKDNVLDKVQKLLALSTSPNENEAALAAEKAHAMLAEHNLSMLDISNHKQETAPKDVTMGHMNATTKHASPWVRTLWGATCYLYFCDYMYSRSGHGTYHYIIGTQANTVTAAEMATYLTDTIIKLSNQSGGDGPYKGNFRKGCSSRIATRLREKRRQEEAPATTSHSNLPAVYQANDTMLAEYIKQTWGETGKARASKQRITDASGYTAGRTAGDRVGLDKQTQTSKTERITSQ